MFYGRETSTLILMSKNTSTTDRIIRLIIAVVSGIGASLGSGVVSIVLWVVSVIMLVTAAIGFCPLYRVLGINTCKIK